MADNLTFEEYRQLVEQNGQSLLEAMAQVATGDKSVDLPVPEGIPVMTDLAINMRLLVNDLQELQREKELTQANLEKIVDERTAELQELTIAVTNSPFIVMITDSQGNIRYVNPRFTAITHFSEEEAFSMTADSLGEQQTGEQEDMWRTIMAGKSWVGEFLNYKKDGSTYWERSHISPVIDENGQVVSFIKIGEDITEQKKLQDAIFTRTQELEEALAESRAVYNRYVLREWESYTDPYLPDSDPDMSPDDIKQWQPAITNLLDSDGQTTIANGSSEPVMTVPINYANEMIGALGFTRDDELAWETEEIAAVEEIAIQVGLALENQRLFDQTQQALAETEQLAANLSQLNELAARISAAPTLEEVYRLTVQGILDILNQFQASLFLIDNEHSEVNVYRTRHSFDEVQYLTGLPLARFYLLEQSIKQRSTVLVPAWRSSKTSLDPNKHRIGDIPEVEGILVAPVILQDEVKAAIVIISDEPNSLTQNDENLLRQVTSILTSTIENRQLIAETRQRAEWLEQLSELESSISQAARLEDLIPGIANAFFNNQNGLILLQYIGVNDYGSPNTYRLVSGWHNGQLLGANTPLFNQNLTIRDFGRAGIQVANRPNQPYITPYIEGNDDFSANTQRYFARFGAKSTTILALRSSGQWQGALTLGWPTETTLHPRDRFLLERIAEPLAATMGTIRANLAQQQALAETAALYQASLAFNRAETIADVLRVFIETIDDSYAESVALWALEIDPQERPEWQVLQAIWRRDGLASSIPVGSRFHLHNYSSSAYWIDSPQRPLLIGDPFNDKRVKDDENFLTLLKQTGYVGTVLLPLRLGPRWVGLVSIQWKTVRHFDDSDSQLYGTLAAQAANTLAGIQLLNETRQRAEQLALLAEIERNLSQATDEEAIVNAMSVLFEDDATVALSYIDRDISGKPIAVYPVSSRIPGVNEDLLINNELRFSVEEFGLPPAVWESSKNHIHYSDVQKDPRTAETILRKAAEQFGYRALSILSLKSVGEWQAILTVSWPDKHRLTANQSFVLGNIAESLGAIVTTRRAQIAQREAREETERLYTASRHINEAGQQLDTILAALASLNPSTPINRIILYLFDYDHAEEEMLAMNVAANWHSGVGHTPTPVGVRYGRRTFNNIAFLLNIEPIFVTDVSLEGRLDENSKTALTNQHVTAFGSLPLWVGSRQIGAIMLECESPHHFPERDIRAYLSLMPQIAVALQNSLLLQETQARAEREQLLREVTEKVRNATNVESVMKTAVSEIGRVLGRKAFVYLQSASQTQISESTDGEV